MSIPWNEVRGTERTIGDGEYTTRRRPDPDAPIESYVLLNFVHEKKTYRTCLAFPKEESPRIFKYKTFDGVHGGAWDGAVSTLALLRDLKRLAVYASDPDRFDRMVTLPDGTKRRMIVMLDVSSVDEAYREARKLRRRVRGRNTPEDDWLDSHELPRAKTVLMRAPHNGRTYQVLPEDVAHKRDRLGYVEVD